MVVSLPSDCSNSDPNMDLQCDSRPVQLAENRSLVKISLLPPEHKKREFKLTVKNSAEDIADIEITKQFRCCINAERLNQIRKKVEDAIREKKTFTIKGGFQRVRNTLLERGWIEKMDLKAPFKNGLPSQSDPPSMDEVCCNLPPKLDWESPEVHQKKCEKMVISRLLQHHEVDFYWSLRRDSNEWQHRLNKNKIINRFSRSLFTSKEGLCLLLQQIYWHTEPGVAFVRFPRTYTINFADQCSAFVEDFRITACISFLKWFTQKLHADGTVSICSPNGKVPVTAIQFAIDRCNDYVAVKKHVDLDKEIHKIWDHEWDQFLTNFHLVIHKDERFEESGCYSLYAFETSAKLAIKNFLPHWPQNDLDGFKNIWIMKPGNKCRGRDIMLIKNVNDVIKVMNHKLKYVVQKYIERPLLIYNTKFDIRQWFMVTCVQPLTIWMYRDCYLRFSTQTFSLDNFHESVHLTNHAVQHKYSSQDRDKCLPDDNMWDNHTFKSYLRQIGQAEKWFKIIYPGMRECIIGAMLASQDTMDRRPNTFELYGADFMICENYTPWLIEINSCPAMGPTTSVTSRMCPQCFEDIVKVVVDRRRDPKADTGLFELVYRQNMPQTPPYLGMSLSVRGKKIFKKKQATKHKSEKKIKLSENTNTRFCKTAKPKVPLELVKDYNGPVIGNLIEELHDSLFKNTLENINDINVPTAHNNSTVDTQQLTVQDHIPVSQKATVSFLCKLRPNKNISFNRKVDASKENRSSNRIKCQNLQKSLSLYKNWKQDLEKKKSKSTNNINKHSWEQDTASILSSKTGSPDLINSCTISSFTNNKILPEIDAKNPSSKLCQSLNLYTVGHGYKNLCYKSVTKEEIILPINNQIHVNNKCCVKL